MRDERQLVWGAFVCIGSLRWIVRGMRLCGSVVRDVGWTDSDERGVQQRDACEKPPKLGDTCRCPAAVASGWTAEKRPLFNEARPSPTRLPLCRSPTHARQSLIFECRQPTFTTFSTLSFSRYITARSPRKQPRDSPYKCGALSCLETSWRGSAPNSVEPLRDCCIITADARYSGLSEVVEKYSSSSPSNIHRWVASAALAALTFLPLIHKVHLPWPLSI